MKQMRLVECLGKIVRNLSTADGQSFSLFKFYFNKTFFYRIEKLIWHLPTELLLVSGVHKKSVKSSEPEISRSPPLATATSYRFLASFNGSSTKKTICFKKFNILYVNN